MASEKLYMPPVTVPFKWLVFVITTACGSLAGVVAIGVWVGSQSTKVEAHDRDIIRLRDNARGVNEGMSEMKARVARINGILEYAFPRQAEKYDSAGHGP